MRFLRQVIPDPIRRWVGAGGMPVAALLALAGQFCLANKGATLLQGVVPGVTLYALAIALLFLSLWLRRARGDDPDVATESGAIRRPPVGLPATLRPGLEWGLVAAIVLGGLFLRLHAIDLVPPGLNNDEAINGLEAEEIAAGKPFATITERGLNRETMFHYLAALSYRYPEIGLAVPRALPALFGLEPKFINDAMMDRIFPLRAVSIAAGTLTLLALYLFARRRFGWHVALLAALLLAISPWHLLYSRVGLRTILAPLFAIVGIALFLRARDTSRLPDHVAWGLVVGLGLWTYTSFRAVPLAMLAFIIVRIIFNRSRGGAGNSAAARPLLIGAGVVALMGGLLWRLSAVSLGDFLFRGAYVTLPPHSNWGLNLLHSLTMTNYYPTRYAVIQSEAFISDGVSTTFGNIGLEPEAIVTAALATLGLLYVVWRAVLTRGKDSACTLILFCALTLLFTVGWTGPSLTRMLLNVPWLCLFAALFAWRIYDVVAGLKRPLTVWAGAAGIAGIVVLACAQGYSNYFLQAGRSARAMTYFGATQTVMGMFTRPLPQEHEVYVFHTLRVDSLRFLIGDRENVHLVSDASQLDLDAIGHSRSTVTLVIEHARRFAEALKYLINRYQLLQSTASFSDGRFDPEKTIFWRSTIWKDAEGRPIPPPGVMTDAPPGMSFPAPPGSVPPAGS